MADTTMGEVASDYVDFVTAYRHLPDLTACRESPRSVHLAGLSRIRRRRQPKRRRARTPAQVRRVRPRTDPQEHPAVHQWEPLPSQAYALRQRGRGSIPWSVQ